MLGPVLCGLLTQAPLLPKLRGCFAEFLGSASSAGLGILSPSTCVGLRYGHMQRHSGFSRHAARALPYSFSVRLAAPAPAGVFPPAAFLRLRRSSHSRLAPRRLRPRSSGCIWYRNLHLLPIGCALRPRLRTRLTQGRQASPWKPWIFGRKDSHLPLATHSGILSSRRSTAPPGAASPRRQCSPTNAP